MNINNVNHLKSQLIKNLHDLYLSAEKASAEIKTDEKFLPNFYDQAAAESGRSVDLIILSREKEMIKEIEDTLALIAHGEFGICRNCGRPISEKRLRVKPTSTLCIECQEKEEMRQRHRSTFSTRQTVPAYSFTGW